MTVTSRFRALDTSNVMRGAEIVSSWATRCLQAAVALYESVLDVAAPGATSQQYRGHDHGAEGGAGLIRNSVFSASGHGTPLFTWTAALGSPSSYWVGQGYISPRIMDSRTSWLLLVRYKVTDGTWHLKLNDGPPVLLDSDSMTYAQARWTLDRDTAWNNIKLTAEVVKLADDKSTSQLDIYSVNIIETYRDSQPYSWLSLRDVTTQPSSTARVLSYFDYLADELVSANEWMDAYTFKTLYSALNALFEIAMDLAAPASSSQYIRGHDHLPLAGGGSGGRLLPRGKMFSTIGDQYLAGFTLGWWTYIGFLLGGAWSYSDAGMTYRRTSPGSTPSGPVTTLPMIQAWVDELFSSSGSPPTTNPYLDGYIAVSCDTPSVTISVRLYHLTSGAVSATTTVTSTSFGKWVYLDKIPCTGGSWNEYAVEIMTSADCGDVTVHGLVFGETYTDSGTGGCYTASSGQKTLAATPYGAAGAMP